MGFLAILNSKLKLQSNNLSCIRIQRIFCLGGGGGGRRQYNITTNTVVCSGVVSLFLFILSLYLCLFILWLTFWTICRKLVFLLEFSLLFLWIKLGIPIYFLDHSEFITGQSEKILNRANENVIKCFEFGSIKRALRPHLRTIIAA